MADKLTNLFWRFSQPITDVMEPDTTRLTHSDAETYDDDPGIGSLMNEAAETTVYTTMRDSETYDDDPGAWPLALPLSE